MDNHSHWHAIESDWDHFKDQIQEKWKKLTDDDMETIHGDRHRLMKAIQSRYSLAKNQAAEQVEEFIGEATNWMAHAKEKVVDAAQRGSEYLMDNSFNDMAADLQRSIRLHPIRSVFISLGIGYLLGRLACANQR